jgi:DNA-binding transcriptional LysR family regulator
MTGADEINWDDLRYFLRAAQAKTLAGAARAMGVDHSTVGRRLTGLERALGAPLFIRRPDGLQLTPLGETLAPLAGRVERAVLALSDQVTHQTARVRVAMPTGFTRLFTASLARLRAEHPALSLEFLGEPRLVDLGKGEADLAIRSGPVGDEDLVARRLGEVGSSLYAAPAYLARRPAPAAADDLRGHDLIGYDHSLAALPVAKWIEEHAGDATIVLRSREMTEMLAAALSGAGIALLPCFLGDEEPELQRLTAEVISTREISLVYRRELRLVKSVRAVIEFVVDVMRENAARVAGTPRDPVMSRGRQERSH